MEPTGGARLEPTDGALEPTDDAWVLTEDALVPTDDALVPTDDAWVLTDGALLPTDERSVGSEPASCYLLDCGGIGSGMRWARGMLSFCSRVLRLVITPGSLLPMA